MAEISCIIINYNTASFTIDCLKSIAKNETDSTLYELIVVDNASKKADFQLLQDFHKSGEIQFKLIQSNVNIGFGAGNMLGVQQAEKPQYFAFINNDTLLFQQDTLKQLKDFMDQNEKIGVCSPQMLDQNKKFRSTIDHFSSLKREFLKRSFLEKTNPEEYPNRKKFYDQPIKVNYIQGSFMFINAEDFLAVGGFDTNLFLYYEESDLCMRILKQRKKDTYLFPDVQYIHFKSMSIKKDDNILIKTELKLSLLYVIKKHQGWLAHQVLLNYLRFRYLLTSIVKPSYFHLFKVLMRGAKMSDSLKYKQKAIS